jgi:hypothetical protein
MKRDEMQNIQTISPIHKPSGKFALICGMARAVL